MNMPICPAWLPSEFHSSPGQDGPDKDRGLGPPGYEGRTEASANRDDGSVRHGEDRVEIQQSD